VITGIHWVCAPSDPRFLSFFHLDQTGKVLSLQSGTIRTNCIDNLDRTNVVQVRTCMLCLSGCVCVLVPGLIAELLDSVRALCSVASTAHGWRTGQDGYRGSSPPIGDGVQNLYAIPPPHFDICFDFCRARVNRLFQCGQTTAMPLAFNIPALVR
jgi:hypothetical protein